MKQYLDLVRYILENGEEKKDRTNTGTLSIFGYQMKINLQEGFPLLTTKKVIFEEILQNWQHKVDLIFLDSKIPLENVDFMLNSTRKC